MSAEGKPRCTVRVDGLRKDIDEETLNCIFESKRVTGGSAEVVHTERLACPTAAFVTFKDENDACKLVEKSRFEFDNMKLTISWPDDNATEADVSKPSSFTSLLVRGTPSLPSKDMLWLYFEHKKRSGGGDIEDITISDADGSSLATIIFKRAEDAKDVLTRGPHKINGSVLEVSVVDLDLQNLEPCAVRVTGLPPGMSCDMIQMFFENKRNGGDIDSDCIFYDSVRHQAVISFESPQVATQVVTRKTFSFSNATMHCDFLPLPPPPPYIPPEKIDSCKLRATQLPTSSDAEVIEFMKRATGGNTNILRITWSTSPGVAVIKFGDKPDYKAVRTYACQKPFKGVLIGIQRVALVSSIIVYPLCGLSEDMLRLYFESTKRSGGDDICNFRIDTDNDYAIIQFNDAIVVDRVVSQKHQIQSHDLNVEYYYEELGPPRAALHTSKNGNNSCNNNNRITDQSVPLHLKPAVPPKTSALPKTEPSQLPVTMPNDIIKPCDPLVAKFLEHNIPFREHIEHELQTHHCKVEWPPAVGDNPKMKLRCELHLDQPDHVHLVANWSTQCCKILDSYLIDQIDVGTVDVEPHIKDAFATEVLALETDDDDRDFIAMLDSQQNKVQCVGMKYRVSTFKKRAVAAVNRLSTLLTSEFKFDLKPHQYELLKIGQLTKKLEEHYSQSKIAFKVTLSPSSLTIEGLQTDVSDAKNRVETQLRAIVSNEVRASTFRLAVLQKPAAIKYFNDLFRSNNIEAIIEFARNVVSVHACGQVAFDTAIHFISSKLVENKISLDDDTALTLVSTMWVKMVEELEMKFPVSAILVTDNQQELICVCQADRSDSLFDQVKQALVTNTRVERQLPVDTYKLEYLNRYCRDQMKDIESKYQGKVTVVVKTEEGRVVISGTEPGITKAAEDVTSCLESIVHYEHDSKVIGVQTFINRRSSEVTLRGIEDKNKVLIKLEEREFHRTPLKSGLKVLPPESARPVVKCEIKLTDLTITIAKGDITKYEMDVIVNAATETLEHRKGVAEAIANVGGNVIQVECSHRVKNKGPLLPAHVFASSPGNLKCKRLLHAVGPVWRGGNNKEKELLAETLNNILIWANEQNMRTLVMPAISIGKTGYPTADGTKVILDSIRGFYAEPQQAEKKCSRPLREIHIVDLSDAVVNHFFEAAIKVFGRTVLTVPGSVKPQPSPSASVAGSHQTTPDGTLSPDKSSVFKPGTDMDTLMTAENLTIKIVCGSIAEQKVDVLVNTISEDLDLESGAVSKSIFKAAGPGLQDEVRKNASGGKVKCGEIIQTGSYKLGCKKVYHGPGLRWDDGRGHSESAVRSLIRKCLETAHQQSMTSIAFPAIGTGIYGMPATECARFLYQEIAEFSSKNSKTKLKDVRLVIKDSMVVQTFRDHVMVLTNQQPATPMAPPRNPHRQIKHKRNEKQSAYVNVELPVASEMGHSNSTFHVTGCYSAADKSVQFDRLKLEVKVGDITKEKLDAIVNSTNDKLDLTLGAVSKCLVRAGGQSIIDECAKLGQTKNGVAVTKPGKLPCKSIIHLAAPSDADSWLMVIKRGLAEAESRKLSSVAFPLLGTGQRDTPPHLMAITFYDAISDFCSTRTSSHLQLVRVTIFQSNMANEFEAALSSKCGGGGGGTSVTHSQFSRDSVLRQPVEADRGRNRDNFYKKTVFCIYASSQGVIDTVVNLIDELGKEGMTDKTIDSENIASLTDEQVAQIHSLCEEVFVDVHVEKGKHINRIRLRGDASQVISAADKIHNVMREKEVEKRNRMEVELIAKETKWEYEANGAYEAYPPDINAVIEKAYMEHLPKVTWEEENGKYEIDFDKMIECCSDGAGPEAKVRRSGSDLIKLPEHWDKMPSNQTLLSVGLTPGSQEFLDVEKNVLATAEGTIDELAIYRIQNPGLYRQYTVRKTHLERVNPPSVTNELILWHGTSESTTELINSGGFNRTYCGKNATFYGLGVYFAKRWTYSARDTYSPRNSDGWKYIYQVRALVGEYTQGKKDMKEPPFKPGSSTVRFESAVDDVNNPEVFVLFHDAEAYPEYLIKWYPKKVPASNP